MKAKELLENVLKQSNTENQGIAVSGLFENVEEFATRWFGESLVTGCYKQNTEYLYSYIDEITGVPDMVVKLKGSGEKVFLYEIND